MKMLKHVLLNKKYENAEAENQLVHILWHKEKL